MVHQQRGAGAVITVENVTITLTTDQIIAAIRQLDPGQQERVWRELKGEDKLELSIQALNSPAAQAVWDNPSDAAVYDAVEWRPGDADS
jgi:hypothetical protein